MSFKLVFKLLITGVFALQLSACGDKDEDKDQGNSNPHTGNEVFEEEVAESPFFSEEEEEGEKEIIRYVNATRLRVRTSTDISDISNVAGVLNTNDKVQVISDADENGMVQILILETQADVELAVAYFTSLNYLSAKTQTRRVQTDTKFKYFMVQNIATEKMRVYEKQCGNGACAHKMIFETDIAVGENSKKDRNLRTIAGSFHINKWIKFYQDGAGRYPSWYHPKYPMPPGPKKGVKSWTKKKVMPKRGGDVRGAFGWYTAFPGPNAKAQWTHGTLGWGADKDKYIQITRGWFANKFADPRSHGCTRTDNESIAYLRSLIAVGTPLIKIYSKEAYADARLTDYGAKTATWNYILTKNGSQKDGELAARDRVLSNGTPKSQWLEQGTYTLDIMPTAKPFSVSKKGARKSTSGNSYILQDSEMNGVFLVDAGLVVNYKHPRQIRVGGYKDKLLPEYMLSESSNYTLPSKKKKKKRDRR